jgi:putative transposase
MLITEELDIKPGAKVLVEGKPSLVRQILDLETVVVQDQKTGKVSQVKLHHLTIDHSDATSFEKSKNDLTDFSEEEWEVALQRFKAIEPLLNDDNRTYSDVSAQAKECHQHPSTLYRWLRLWHTDHRISSLVPMKPGSQNGQSRLSAEVEAIIRGTIKDIYLQKQKPTVTHIHREILRLCHNSDLAKPHLHTIRKRVAAISDQELLNCRYGHKAMRDKYEPIKSKFPGANWPLAVIQIDHTPLDLILVDDEYRQPVGRPWITLAIDVFSRMVMGFYISFDSPNITAVGLCLAHSILPNEDWLVKHCISTSWPIWGIMGSVHLDNAKEFRSKMLLKACQEYNIDIHWRPVARPNFGAHIERLLGTFNHEIHNLPGSTFSSPKERGKYKSESKSALTLTELERWLTIHIVEVYHQRLHKELSVSPLKKYEEGIFGTSNYPGRGLPKRIVDETRLRLDFMEFQERTVQRHGIAIDGINYYESVLRPWINANDCSKKSKKKFIIRRDPRDISRIYFYDPELKQYFEIPYRDTTRPSISIWELRAAKKKLKEEGLRSIDEHLIFEAINRLRKIESEAVNETIKSRRKQQRQRSHQKVKHHHLSNSSIKNDVKPDGDSNSFVLEDLDDIHPFEIVEL